MFQAAKEAQSLYNWLLPFLPVLGVAAVPIPIFNDNDGASALALDPVGRFKNKHIRMHGAPLYSGASGRWNYCPC